MTYINCADRFSPMQVNAMKNLLAGDYSNIVSSTTTPSIVGPNTVCSSATFSVSNSGFSSIYWTSSKPSVASVGLFGEVTKLSNGETIITAEINDNLSCNKFFVTKKITVGNNIKGTYRYGTNTYTVNGSSIGIGLSGSTPTVNIQMETDNNTQFTWTKAWFGGYHSLSTNNNIANLYLSNGAYLNLTCQSTNS